MEKFSLVYYYNIRITLMKLNVKYYFLIFYYFSLFILCSRNMYYDTSVVTVSVGDFGNGRYNIGVVVFTNLKLYFL